MLSRKKSSKTAVSVADTAQRLIEPVHEKSLRERFQRVLSRKKSSKTAVSVADSARQFSEPVHKKSLRETFQRVLSKKSSHAQVDMAPQQMEVQVVA